MRTPAKAIIPFAIVLLASCGDKKGDGDDDTSTDGVVDATDTTGDGVCSTDSDCDDGLFCNGSETCDEGATCQPGVAVDCDDDNPCTLDVCDEDEGECTNDALDADGDGWTAMRSPTGEDCGGEDCNDGAASVYPDAPETECDLVDSDCDGDTSEHIDDDGDDWIDEICDDEIDDPGSYEGTGDCNDEDVAFHPEAAEGCDGTIDHDCDGDATEVESDTDGDGVAPESCGGDDCDDTDDTVYPGADEVCDDVDQDCDGDILDAAGADDDGDTVLDSICGGADCDDTDETRYGGADEICDDIDQDCDTLIFDAVGADDDGDTVLDVLCGGTDCDDLDPYTYPGAAEALCDSTDNDCDGDDLDGVADQDNDDFLNDDCPSGNDCDDLDAAIHPGATPVCDMIDDDCSGYWQDEAGADDDSDDFLDEDCGGNDCDDTNSSINIYADEGLCDTVDDDCDGDAIDGWADQDDDDFLNIACAGGTDCDDLDSAIHPGASTTCDMVDDDCSGTWQDEAGADDDSDGYLDSACGGDDCNDGAGSIHPGADEICNNGVDEDCDGSTDGPKAMGSDVMVVGPSASIEDPSIAFSGSEFAVVWQGFDSSDEHIIFRRIDTNGAFLSSGIPITNDVSASKEATSIVWTGSEYGVAWEDSRASGTQVFFARLDPLGTNITSDVQVTTVPNDWMIPSLTWSGSEFGIGLDTFVTSREAAFARVSSLGVPISTGMQLTSTIGLAWHNEAVWVDGDYIVVWEDNRDFNLEMYLARIGADGTVLTSDVRLTNDMATTQWPSMAWSGSQIGLAFNDSRDGNHEIYFMLLEPDGTPAGSEMRMTDASGQSTNPDVVWIGSGWSIVWADDRTSVQTPWQVFLDPAGTPTTSDLQVSDAARVVTIPSHSWTGSALGIAWQDRRSGAEDVYFNIVELCE